MKQSASYPPEFATAVLHKHEAFVALALAYVIYGIPEQHLYLTKPSPGKQQLCRPPDER